MDYIMARWQMSTQWWVAHANVDVVVVGGFFLTLALLAWWFCRD